MLKSQHPTPQSTTLFGNKSLYRGNRVKMRKLWGALTNVTDILKNGESWTQDRWHNGELCEKTQGEGSRGEKGWRERWRRAASRGSWSHGMDSLSEPPGGSRADSTLTSDFQPKKYKAVNFCYFKPPCLWYFATISCIQIKCFYIFSARNNWNFKLKSPN